MEAVVTHLAMAVAGALFMIGSVLSDIGDRKQSLKAYAIAAWISVSVVLVCLP